MIAAMVWMFIVLAIAMGVLMSKKERIPKEQQSPYEDYLRRERQSFQHDAHKSDYLRRAIEEWDSSARGLTLEVEPLSKEDLKRAQLEAAEHRAREPVQQFVIETKSGVTWDDIVGNEEAHRAMIEAVEFPLKHPELFAHYGKKPSKGILLKGPPGCGKTMLGKAAANTMGATLMLGINGAALQQIYIGQTEKLIKSIFAYARAYRALHGHQLVVFIDEAEVILPQRGSGHWFQESNVATFLAEMDGLEDSAALIILATNRPEAIDTALLRDGRVDRKVTVQRPTAASARIIFERELFKVPGYRAAYVDNAMAMFFDPMRQLLRIKHEKGTDFLTLGDVVSGAMMVGLVERIKASAFQRDVAARTMTGITDGDVVHAVEQLTIEQREQLDHYALMEFAQRVNSPMLEIDRVRQPEIKYTGTLQ